MQPSTWNDTNQHWVSQFLLKGFGIKGKASRVWELDKQTKLIEKRKVRDVASKPKLLTESDDELMIRIENEATQPIGQIRKRNLPITEKDRRAIDQLVAAMMQNDPYNGFDEEMTRQSAIEAVTKPVKEAIEHWGGVIEPGVLETFANQRLNHDYLTLALGRDNSMVPTMLGQMGLQAIYAPEGESFIVGDSPVLAVRHRGTDGPSLLNLGSQVILPISSQCILFYAWSTEQNLIVDGGTVDSQQLLSINQDYLHQSNCRFLYGRTEECLTRSRQLRISWENPQRSTNVSRGWLAMRQHLASVHAKDAEEEEQASEMLMLEARELVLKAARQNTLHS